MAISNEELYDLYVNKNWSIRKINLHSGVGRPTLSRRLKEMDVEIKGNHPNQERRYSKDIDTSFFQRESDEKYYVLGFFFADGSFTENGIKFDQTEADREILDKIKEVMKAETDVKVYKNTEFKIDNKIYVGNPMCRLSISRISFKKELLELGFALNKTYVESTPNIPKEYIGSFLRGFFDGDGSVTVGSSTALSFTIKEKGNAVFISELLKEIGTEPFIYYRESRDVYTVIIRRKKELQIVRKSIYENANHLYLQRKKDKFDLL